MRNSLKRQHGYFKLGFFLKMHINLVNIFINFFQQCSLYEMQSLQLGLDFPLSNGARLPKQAELLGLQTFMRSQNGKNR